MSWSRFWVGLLRYVLTLVWCFSILVIFVGISHGMDGEATALNSLYIFVMTSGFLLVSYTITADASVPSADERRTVFRQALAEAAREARAARPKGEQSAE